MGAALEKLDKQAGRIGHIYPLKRRIGHIYPLKTMVKPFGSQGEAEDKELKS